MKHVKSVENTKKTRDIVTLLNAQEPMVEEQKNAVCLLDDDTFSDATKALEQRLLSMLTVDQQADMLVGRLLRLLEPAKLDAGGKRKIELMLQKQGPSKGNADNQAVIDDAKSIREDVRKCKAFLLDHKRSLGLSSDMILEDALKLMEERVQSISDPEERNQQLAMLTAHVKQVFDKDAIIPKIEVVYAERLEALIKNREKLKTDYVQMLKGFGVSEVDAKAIVYDKEFPQYQESLKKPTSGLSEQKKLEPAKSTASSSNFFPQPPKSSSQETEQPHAIYVDSSPKSRATQQAEPRYAMFVDPSDSGDASPKFRATKKATPKNSDDPPVPNLYEKESGCCRCVIL